MSSHSFSWLGWASDIQTPLEKKDGGKGGEEGEGISDGVGGRRKSPSLMRKVRRRGRRENSPEFPEPRRNIQFRKLRRK